MKQQKNLLICLTYQNGESMNWLYEELINYFQEEGHSYDTELNEFRCSQLTECPRQLYYQKKYPVEPTEYLKGIFTVGHIFHKTIQLLLLRKYPKEYQIEVPVEYKDNETDIVIVGHADIVSDDKVVDIKTVSRLPTDAYYKHHLQVNTYAHLLDRQYYGILYVEKNTLRMQYFEYRTSTELFNYVLGICREVYRCLLVEKLPDIKLSNYCKWCPYRQLCAENKL